MIRCKKYFVGIFFICNFVAYFLNSNLIEMTFEWDENKRLLNLKKHGIDFADARAVFEDKQRFSIIDSRYDYGEMRMKTVGKMNDKLVVLLIHTDRNKNIRIISARRANKTEREQYYGNS